MSVPPRRAPDFEAQAAALDRADPLAPLRNEFHLPPGVIYLDGNSLGPLSRRAEAGVRRVLEEWRTAGIGGWTDGRPPWVTWSETLAARVAPLVGASAAEVAVTGSTTINLHQLLATLFSPTPGGRGVILADELNFSSDLHAITSHLRLRGLDPQRHLRKVRSRDRRTLAEDDIIAAFGDDVQLVVLPTVLFVSGQLLDTARLTREARARGIIIGWDCSHSIGAVPHALAAEGADFGFWCSYKYLNAGPGAVGGLFLHQRHHRRAPGLAGWWGVEPERRFALVQDHDPAAGAARLQIGTPHLLSLAPLDGALDVLEPAGGVARLREKSLAQTQLMIEFADAELAPLGLRLTTPVEPSRRGGHVALAHPHAWQLCQALRAAGVVTDCRPPDIIRLAPAPLYNSFAECVAALRRLQAILQDRRHESFPHRPALVT